MKGGLKSQLEGSKPRSSPGKSLSKERIAELYGDDYKPPEPSSRIRDHEVWVDFRKRGHRR